MNLPNLQLLHMYGNEQVLLEKAAGYGSLAARLAFGILASDNSLNARAEEERQQEQAARMAQAFRLLEARKMDPVRSHMDHSRMPVVLMAGRAGEDPEVGLAMADGLPPSLYGVPRALRGQDIPLGADEGMVRIASAIGADLAFYTLSKEAGLGTFVSGLGRGMGGLGRGISKGVGSLAASSGRALSKGVLGVGDAAKSFAVGKLQNAGQMSGNLVQSAKDKLQGAMQSVSGTGKALERTGNRIQGKLENFGAKLEGNTSQKPFSQMSSGQKQVAADQRLQRIKDKGISPGGQLQPPPEAPSSTAQPTPIPHPQPAQPSAPKSEPVQPASSGGEGEPFDLQKAWNRTGLSDGRWKWKLPLLAGGALAAHGLYQGAKKGFEILGQESAPAQYNSGGAIPAYGVNEYGAPDRSTPFTY